MKCQNCGAQKINSVCPQCDGSFRHNDHQSERERLPNIPEWVKTCPVCRVKPLRPALEKILWDKPTSTSNFRCDNCRALFIRHGSMYELRSVKNQTREVWIRYHNLLLSTEQWITIAKTTRTTQ
jgi:hypothetical protein